MSRWLRNKAIAKARQARIDNAMPAEDEEEQDDEEQDDEYFVEPDFDDNQISNYYDGK